MEGKLGLLNQVNADRDGGHAMAALLEITRNPMHSRRHCCGVGGVGRSTTLLEPLQADGVGTAVLQRAEELLEDPLVPLLVYRHRIPFVILEERRADDALWAQRIPDRHFQQLQ